MGDKADRRGAISSFIKELKNIKADGGHTLYFRGHPDEIFEAVPSIKTRDTSPIKQNFW